MVKVDTDYKVKDNIDLTILINYGFDYSPQYNEYYRYYREDEYLWVNKFSRKIDMTSPSYFCKFTRCKRIINELMKAGLLEQSEEK